MDECKECGEIGVIQETENGRTVRVCTECGVLADDVEEYVTTDIYEGTTVTDGKGRGPDAARPWQRAAPSDKKGKIFGKTNIRRLGNQLNFSIDMILEATALYDRVFETDLKRSSNEKRLAMCVACLYCTARLNGRGLGIKDVASFIDIKEAAKKIAASIRTLKTKFDIHLPAVTVAMETDNFFAKNDFSVEVKKLTHDIMTLCDRYWLSQGRLHDITVIVAVYFAWRACNFSNRTIELSAFCKKFDLTKPSVSAERKIEVEKLLRSIVQEIPWLKGQTITNIDPYIKDAVTFQSSLMQQTLETAALKKQQATHNVHQTLQNSLPRKDIEIVFRYKSKVGRKSKTVREEEPQRKRKKSEAFECNSDDENILDLGSDDDTDLYIKSPQEVENCKKLYAEAEEAQTL